MKIYPLSDSPHSKELKRLGADPMTNRRWQLRAVCTGEFRAPKKGEWFLSGAVPEAYKAKTGKIAIKFYIARLVRVEVRTVEEIKIVQE